MNGARRGTARKERAAPAGRRVAYTVLGLGVVGLVAGVILGAPLVSILLVGLLLLCPLLMWVPFSLERRTPDESIPERRTHGTHA